MEDLNALLRIQNPHWEADFSYPYPLRRKPISKFIGQLSHNLILSITGPRRVGKTVALKQLINHLVQSGFPRNHILFFSFDEGAGSILEIISAWERLASLKVRGANYFLLLDEIQNVEGWAVKLKTVYDALGPKIIISGSASMPVRKGGESLAGRIIETAMPPLSFGEYLMLRGQPQPAPVMAEEEYTRYMNRQLPELALNPSLSPSDYVSSIVKKVIHEDCPHYFHTEETAVIDGMFKVICNDPGQVIAPSSIARDFGISRITASRYLQALEHSFLARKLYNFSRNARKVEVRSKKYYPYYTTLALYGGRAEFSKLSECEAAFQTGAEYFYNNAGQEIDFLLGPAHDVGLEVKMRKKVERADLSCLLKGGPGVSRKAVLVGVDSQVAVSGVEVVRLPQLATFSESLNTEIVKK